MSKMSTDKASNSDNYHLRRTYAASARLNLQHHQWLTTFDCLLHWTIPVPEKKLRVADVATGTGIWLIDFSHYLVSPHSKTVHLDGFDISLDQVPPTAWLPPNIRFRLYDVQEEPHEDMLEKYDVVHVRHLNLVIKNNDPTTVLDHLLKMLKPGGYLQWGEFDLGKIQEVKANPDCSVAEMRGLQKRIRDFLPSHAASWPSELGKRFKEAGLHNVCYEARWTHESRLRTVIDVGLLAAEEMVDRIASEKKATVEEIEELRVRLVKAADESRKGAAWDLESIVAVGQKPARLNTE